MFRYLSVREAVPTHALGFFTQLSLESLAITELVSLGGPWVRGEIFRAKRMFYVAFGVLRVGWKDGSRQQGWAGGRGGGLGFCFSAHCLSSSTFFHHKPEWSPWDGWFPQPCIVMVCPGCVRQGPCQLAPLLNSQNPYSKVITDQKSRLSHTTHNYFQIPRLGSSRNAPRTPLSIGRAAQHVLRGG